MRAEGGGGRGRGCPPPLPTRPFTGPSRRPELLGSDLGGEAEPREAAALLLVSVCSVKDATTLLIIFIILPPFPTRLTP